jgi:ADP-heptose:LPS heptosyltransferase
LRIERRWPAHSFVELTYQLRKKYPAFEIYLVGSKSESEYVSEVSNHFKKDALVHDVSGKTSLKELIALISKSTLVITNDTGPMHLSAAMQKNTVALFGPCSPSQYAIGKTVFPIYKNVYCSPCVHEFITPPCKGANLCMQLIEVKEVMNAVDSFFIEQWEGKDIKEKIYASESNTVFGTVTRD